jgi:hypothetical protein
MSNQCSLLQILVAATLLSVTAFSKRYPYPFSCNKYYVQLPDNTFSLNSCPNNWYFNQITELCQKAKPTFRYITYTDLCPCTGGIWPEYCCTDTKFTYCSPDGLTIVLEGICPQNPCVCVAVNGC